MADKFFLVIPPGFETLALEELQEKWTIHFTGPLPPNEIKPGGIDLETDLSQGMALNLILKIPTRILLRIDSFKCRDFPKLFKKVIKLNWNNYLLGKVPEINSTSKNSRIFDSRKIEKCFHDGILEHFKRQPPKKKNLEKGLNAPLFSIFVRFENDECLISIDSSGDPLYKRGIKTLSSIAPIRENLAAALLYFLKKNLKNNTEILIDPMCGSGTFLLESANFYGLNNQRNFDFKYFPLMEKIIFPNFSPKKLGLFKKHLGFDIDEKMLKNANSNLEGLGATLAKRDIFSKVSDKESPNVVIVNPPYGKRIKEVPNFKKLIQTIKENYSPNLLGIIVPSEIHLNLGKKISFKNGGFKVNFWVFKP
jgi:putative N6-adenine-specific DNA methylase